MIIISDVTRGGGGPPRVTPSTGGDTRTEKNCGQIYKELWTNEIGEAKKGVW